MATRLVLKKPKSTSHITYNTKSNKLHWKKRLLYATGFVSVALVASILQGVYISENPKMKDTFWTSGMVIERDETKELKDQIEQYKKEVEKLNSDTKQMIENHKRELSSRGDTTTRKSMYDYKKLTAPEEISKIIELKCKEIGFESMDEIYSIISYESNFDPKARTSTKHEDSRGLLQINTFTNFPKNLDKNKLYDPAYNLEYQLPELYDFYKLGKSKGLKGIELSCYISRLGQRPLWSSKNTRDYIIKTITKFYNEVIAAKLNKNTI